MSFFRKVSKVFRKVTSSKIGKVIGGALAIGAIVFTGGAALGLAPMAGGWGAAMGSLAGTLGLTGTLGSVLTGAFTMAGYGAALGGIGSLAMGGDFFQGAAGGALIGGATGGLMGGMGFATDPLAGAFGDAGAASGATPATPATSSVTGASAATNAPTVSGGALSSPMTGPQFASAGAAAPVSTAGTPFTTAAGAAPAAPTGGLFGTGGWIERNGTLVGTAVSGLGQGLMGGMAARDSGKADQRLRDQITGSFNIDYSDRSAGMGGDASKPSPENRFGSRKRYAYNPESRRIELMEG
jgi:hypothetical protein